MTTGLMILPLNSAPVAYPLLLPEDELVQLLRIPEISMAKDHHHVVENLRRMPDLPCIDICKAPAKMMTRFVGIC